MAARFPPLDLPSSVLGEARKAILDLEAKSDNKTITLAERKLTTPRARYGETVSLSSAPVGPTDADRILSGFESVPDALNVSALRHACAFRGT